MFCVFCLTNTGFVQLVLFPRAAPIKFVARLFCILLYSVIFCFACFASQTSGLRSAFPSVPVESVTRFCYALVRNLFCLFCLTNTGFVRCYSSAPVKFVARSRLTLLYSVIFVLRALPHMKTSELCSAFPSAPVKSVTRFCYALVRTLFCVFFLTNIGLVQCFPFGSPQVYTLLVFFILVSLLLLCVLCPTSSALCSDFSPVPLEFARFIFLLCIIQF